MEIAECLKILLLFIIAYEGGWFLIKWSPKTKEDAEEETVHTTRRDVYGVYKNPLGDSYRKNKRNLYVPIKPGEKMIDSSGDDEE